MATFGERLQAERRKRGWTQSDLADQTGVALPTLRDYEQGKRDPLASSLAKLARGLGISLDVLADGVEWSERGGGTKPAAPRRSPAKKPGRGRK